MEQLTEEKQKQVKKMSTARIRQRLIKAGFTELGLEGLSREELMDALAEHMIKQELSSGEEEEEEEEEEKAIGGAKVKKPPEQTVESDPLPTFVNPSMTMEGIIQMMMMMRQDKEKRRREQEEKEEKRRREQEEKEEKRRREQEEKEEKRRLEEKEAR